MTRSAAKGWEARHKHAADLGIGRGHQAPVWLVHGDEPIQLVPDWSTANRIATAEFQATGRMLRILTRGDMVALRCRDGHP